MFSYLYKLICKLTEIIKNVHKIYLHYTSLRNLALVFFSLIVPNIFLFFFFNQITS